MLNGRKRSTRLSAISLVRISQETLPAELHRLAWKALLEKQPGILVASMVDGLAELSHYDALESTATGFISRDTSVGDLSRAIIAAGWGEIILPAELAKKRWLIEF